MSTTKKFGLSKLALQSNSAQCALSSMRNFYQNNTGTGITNTAFQQRQQQQQQQHQMRQVRQVKDSLWLEERRSPHRVPNVGRLSKVIGVKKTLVNQMQGMVQTLRPKMKSHSVGLAQTGSKYKIYGRTKLFSSMSSLQTRSSRNNSSSAIYRPAYQNRCMSSSAQSTVPLNSAVQHRYNQFGELQDKRNGDLARDISRSIQSELMDVDLTTKRLISCARDKLEQSSFDHGVDQQQPQQQQQQQHQQQLQMQSHHQPLRFDPLGGWNHPRPMMPVDALAKEDNIKKQQKPLRRKPTNIRYKEDASEPPIQQQQQQQQQKVTKASLQSRNLQAQLGDLYAQSSKLRSKKPRSDMREPHFPNTEPASSQYNRELGSFAERYKQTTSERNYIERNVLKNEREEVAPAPLDDNGRMDNLHYQSKIAANLMSASQRVINKQFEGYRNYLLDSRHKSKLPMLSKNPVPTANPTPLSKVSAKPANPNARILTMGRASSVNPDHLSNRPKAVSQTKRAAAEVSPKKNKFMVAQSVPNKIAAVKKLEKTMRSKSSSNPLSNKSSYQYAQHGGHQRHQYSEQRLLERQGLLSPSACQMQMGEMRDYQKTEDYATQDSLKNDVGMPSEYTRESAVQRLGIFCDRRTNHASYLAQQRVRQ